MDASEVVECYVCDVALQLPRRQRNDLETVHSLVTCAVMLWVVFDGPVVATRVADEAARALKLMIVVMVLFYVAARRLRQVRPTATPTAGALRDR